MLNEALKIRLYHKKREILNNESLHGLEANSLDNFVREDFELNSGLTTFYTSMSSEMGPYSFVFTS
jgi:hypothetical protein